MLKRDYHIILKTAEVRHIQSSKIGMICDATIIFGSVSIDRKVIVDNDFTEELILEHKDILALSLGDPIRNVTLKLEPGLFSTYDVYDPVLLQFQLSDGSTVSASLTPLVLHQLSAPMTR